MDGGCACGAVRYRIEDDPLFVHCCHCSYCQRETGSAFVINVLIERSRLAVTGETAAATLPSASGRGQVVHRCPYCSVAVFSHYAGSGPAIAFVRGGTLDMPDAAPPDVHIFTTSALHWVQIPSGATVFSEFYSPSKVWSDAARTRFRAARDAIG